MKNIPDKSIDLVLTDPPYGLNFNAGNDMASRWEAILGIGKVGDFRPIIGDSPKEWTPILEGFLRETARILKRTGCCCCCCAGGGGPTPIFAQLTLLMDKYLTFKHAVVWDKGGLGLGFHYRRNYEFVMIADKGACKWNGVLSQPNIIRIPKILPQADQHPTAKPEALMEIFIRLHTDKGDVVLDPFAGHGTTCVAAKKLQRNYIGIEIDQQYCEISRRRLAEIDSVQEEFAFILQSDDLTGSHPCQAKAVC